MVVTAAVSELEAVLWNGNVLPNVECSWVEGMAAGCGNKLDAVETTPKEDMLTPVDILVSTFVEPVAVTL